RLTAAVSSQISDASAAILIASEAAVQTHGLKPRARIHHLSVRGADPIWMLTAPIPATAHALAKSGMTMDAIDLVEINEAFASVVLAWEQEVGYDPAKVNVNGGAIALGHPLGATGARLMTTLPKGPERRGGGWAWRMRGGGGGGANDPFMEGRYPFARASPPERAGRFAGRRSLRLRRQERRAKRVRPESSVFDGDRVRG